MNSRDLSTLALLLLTRAILLSAAALALDHDSWEFYGGQRRRIRHGLNRATKDLQNQEPAKIVVTNDQAPPAPKIEATRTAFSQRFKDKQEALLLIPDSYSVLSFDKDPTDGDDNELPQPTTESSFWGKLYVEGFSVPIQYFRAHFGQAPPSGVVKLLLASPINLCDDVLGFASLDNADKVDENTIIFAMRGECTFSEKASAAFEAGAAGIVFINNVEGNEHPSGPEVRDLKLSASMIEMTDGEHLIQALKRVDFVKDEGYTLKARFVPMLCDASAKSNSYCEPVMQNDKDFISDLRHSGELSLAGGNFEYLQGEFGAWIDPTVEEWKTIVPSGIGGDEHCCEVAGFRGNQISNTSAVLCLRGECDFVTKAENIASTGAGMMIVASHNSTLYRMGAEPPYRGRQVNISTLMIGADSYDHMVDAYYSNLDYGMDSTISIVQPEFASDTCQAKAELVQ